MSVLDQNGRIQALGFLARWRLTSHALYYKIPYLGSKRRPVVNPFLAAFSQKSLASAYVFELELKLQEGRKVFVEIRYFRKLKVILPKAGSVYNKARTIKIAISSPFARETITFVIILKINTLSILAGIIPTII